MKIRKKNKSLCLLLCLILLIGTLCLLGKTNSVNATDNAVPYSTWLRTVYGKDNGLSCGVANDIATTSDGLIWIGTYAGLYRNNGSEIKLMSEFDTVKNANKLYVDDKDRLWVCTNDTGLSVFLDETFLCSFDETVGLPSDSVRDVVKCSDGKYYVGTSDSLAILTFANDTLTLEKVLDEVKYAQSLSADKNGFVCAIDSNNKLFLIKNGELVSTIDSKNIQNFTCCSFRSDGKLFVGTSKGIVYSFNVSSSGITDERSYACDLDVIKSLFFENEERLFVCSDTGIGYFEGADDLKFNKIQTGDFNNSIDNMIIDYQGNLWFSSSRMGVLRLCKNDFSDIFAEYSLPSAVVNTVERNDNLMYIGTDSGLIIIDEENGAQIENPLTEELAGIRIRCILRDSNGNLWFCTYKSKVNKGLVKLESNGNLTYFNPTNSSNIGNNVRTIIEKNDGTIVVSSETGIGFIKDNNVQFVVTESNGLENMSNLCLLETSDGSILAGSDGNGIAVISADGTVKSIIDKSNGLTSGVVMRIVKDPYNKGFFVITSNSICYLDENMKVSVLNNFPYSNNYDLICDGDRVFVLGSAGIFVVNHDELVQNKPSMDYDILDSKVGLLDSLTANSWNLLEDDGTLYLSTNSGVSSLNISSYGKTQKPYLLSIGSVFMNGKRYKLPADNSIILSQDVKKLEIVPEIINFSITDPIVYCYLEGFDETPIRVAESELSTLVYTNLAGGNYTFRLAIIDSITGETIDEHTFRVKKEMAFYENIWFIFAAIAAFVALSVFVGIKITNIRFKKKLLQHEKELELSRRQIEMSNETILAIAKTVDAKDPNTSQHSTRVSSYAVKLAKAIGHSEKECDAIRQIALLHDIGKIGIPDSVLKKPDKLTNEDYALMKTHVTKGAEILKDFTLVENVDEGVRYHHERYDGKGYPLGLVGDNIPLNARIICIADSFDAMTSNRVYRNAMDVQTVIDELKRCKGTQFDPNLVDIFIDLVENGDIDLK